MKILFVGVLFMSKFTRFKLCAAAALVFTAMSDSCEKLELLKQNTFFPSQALEFDAEEKSPHGELVVISPKGKIEISFKIAELLKNVL